MPSAAPLLVEAGLQCIPLIHSHEVRGEPTQRAVQRLVAVIARLRLCKPDDRTRRALDEFERAVRAHGASSTRCLVLGLAVMAEVAGLVVLLLR